MFHFLRRFFAGFALATTGLYLSLSTASAQAAGEPPSFAEFSPILERSIHTALDKLGNVPGLSVAVYTQEGRYAQGFGVADIETGEAVTDETAFYIASSTKSMFALAMSVLHDRGEIDLDQSLADYAPKVPFPRKIQADQIRLRDLLAMSSGIKNPAVVHRLAYSGEHDPDLLWRLMGETQANKARTIRRGHFRYTNWNYNLMARLIEEERGTPWQDILAEELFNKAGMRRTTAYISRARAEGWSLARPHISLGGDRARRSYLEKTDETMHAAGGVIMSARDAIKWLEILIEDGVVHGEQRFPAEAVRATRKPWTQVDTVFSGRYPYQRDHYGFGWYIGPYGDAGVSLVHHFGGFSGARSHISYMPEHKIGVVVSVNDNLVGSGLADLVANYVYDTLIGNGDAQAVFDNGVYALDAWAKDLNAQIIASRAEIAARPSKLTEPLKAYAGLYSNEAYGNVIVSVVDTPKGEALHLQNGNLAVVAQAGRRENTIRVEYLPLEGEELVFKLGRRGQVESFKFQGVRYRKM